MKKKLLLLISGMYLAWNANAQISQGGFPLSMRSGSGMEIPVREYVLPKVDKAALAQEFAAEEESGRYSIGKVLETDIKFPESGTLMRADDGSFIWKVMASVPGAKGIIMYFDHFQLPQGVSLFVHNENKKHVLGAFTAQNNDTEGRFAIDAVQGNKAYLELNIAPGVNVNDIVLELGSIGAVFRGYDDLSPFADDLRPIDIVDDAFFASSSVCMILANCPTASGKDVQKNATVQTVVNDGGLYTCSATLVNNTGNSKTNCTKYILSATHCERTGARSGTVFTKYIVRFNYEHPACDWVSTHPTTTKSITNGISFVSRSDYDEDASTSLMKADFLLLKINTVPPGSNAQLNGWNKAASIPTSYPSSGSKKFYGFHHPAGDVKAYSSSKQIESYSIGATGTHWTTQLEEGYIAGGSSGSALFDNEGYAVGIASLAPDGVAPASCLVDRLGNSAPRTTSRIHYSKLSYCWENPGDAVDGATESRKKLSPWLDPAGTGVNKLAPTDANCSTMATQDFVEEFGVTMNMYPNPSVDGKFNISVKLNDATDLKFEIFDISGRRIMYKELPGLKEQTASIDLSAFANGVYYVKLSNAYGFTSQKIVITK